MKVLVAFLALLALLAVALGDNLPIEQTLRFPPRTGFYRIVPGKVVDGDTLHFSWLVEDTARLSGIDAPELGDDAGTQAKDYLSLLTKNGPIRARVIGRDKYGRALLDLFDGNGKSISQQMIDAGHAHPWGQK